MCFGSSKLLTCTRLRGTFLLVEGTPTLSYLLLLITATNTQSPADLLQVWTGSRMGQLSQSLTQLPPAGPRIGSSWTCHTPPVLGDCSLTQGPSLPVPIPTHLSDLPLSASVSKYDPCTSLSEEISMYIVHRKISTCKGCVGGRNFTNNVSAAGPAKPKEWRASFWGACLRFGFIFIAASVTCGRCPRCEESQQKYLTPLSHSILPAPLALCH